MKEKVLLCMVSLFFLISGFAAAERVSISSDKINIRSGPGKNYDIIATIEGATFYPLKVISKKGQWFKISDVEGYQGWIYSELVSNLKTVITTSDTCNIRKGPGKDHPIIMIAEKGASFKVLKNKGDWFHIQDSEGDDGWIYKSLVW